MSYHVTIVDIDDNEKCLDAQDISGGAVAIELKMADGSFVWFMIHQTKKVIAVPFEEAE